MLARRICRVATRFAALARHLSLQICVPHRCGVLPYVAVLWSRVHIEQDFDRVGDHADIEADGVNVVDAVALWVEGRRPIARRDAAIHPKVFYHPQRVLPQRGFLSSRSDASPRIIYTERRNHEQLLHGGAAHVLHHFPEGVLERGHPVNVKRGQPPRGQVSPQETRPRYQHPPRVAPKERTRHHLPENESPERQVVLQRQV
eukprot:scaffold889_cov268-Pinguiococcus_pyrenoidosus.AAC.13